MLESIYVGMTGLLGYSNGLRVIANNTANINTPGFKGSSIQFADLFYTGGEFGSGQNSNRLGFGLDTNGTTLSFKQGELRQTGNDLDMAVDGLGLFVLKNPDGGITYSRAGQFEFNKDGILVNKGNDLKVMGFDSSGNLVEINTNGFKTNAGQATQKITFSGNLSSTGTEQTVNDLNVFDVVGETHALSVKLTAATDPGTWNVELLDGATSIGTGSIIFEDGKPKEGNSKVEISYGPNDLTPTLITLDFSTDVTSFASGNLSTLAKASQDGYAPGGLTKVTFDAKGTLIYSYSNGQTTKGTSLALARFDSLDSVTTTGENQFKSLDDNAWHLGLAGQGVFGNIKSGSIEISNVDLSQEFSDLVVMQRGYQASSQVISTANDMLQELFSMRSK